METTLTPFTSTAVPVTSRQTGRSVPNHGVAVYPRADQSRRLLVPTVRSWGHRDPETLCGDVSPEAAISEPTVHTHRRFTCSRPKGHGGRHAQVNYLMGGVVRAVWGVDQGRPIRGAVRVTKQVIQRRHGLGFGTTPGWDGNLHHARRVS